MNRLVYLTFFSVTLLLANIPAFAQTVFVEENGRLIVEVESATAYSDWHYSTDFPDYRGDGHFEWTGSGTTGLRSAGRGALVYHFTINTPGNYEFRWRSRIGEGTNGTESNDSWVRFPTGSNVTGEQPLNGWTKGFMNELNAWSWRTVTVDHVGNLIRQHFTAGEHTLEIAGRSRGHVLDRFVLFKYDDVRFNDGVFSNAPQSPSTGDDPTLANSLPEPEPEPEPEQNADLNSPTDNTDSEMSVVEPVQPWQIPANQLGANECSDGVISLRPVSDITLDSNEIANSGELRLNDAGRATLLKFDLSNVPATVNTAALAFSVGADDGEGSVVLSAGSHSDWNETDASLLPDVSHLIGSFNGTWSQEKRYGLPFDHTLVGSNSVTLVMEMEQGANDVSIFPSINNNEPRLELTGSGAFCAEYEVNLAGSDSDLKSELISVVETETDGGGSLQLLELLLLTLSLAAVRGYVRRES